MNVLEKILESGARVRGHDGPEFAHSGDVLEAIRTVRGVIAKGTTVVLEDVVVEKAIAGESPKVRLILQGYEGDWKPSRFRLVSKK